MAGLFEGRGPLLGLRLAVAASMMGCMPAADAPSPSAEDDADPGTSGAEATAQGSAEPVDPNPGPPPEGMPRILVTGPALAAFRPAPALFLGPEPDAPAVGYLGPGTLLRLESAPSGGRVEVSVGGALRTRAWVPTERLAAYAQERGLIRGTRAYVGPNDLVGVVGPAEEEGMLRVSVRPWLGGTRYLEAMKGTYPAAALGPRRVDESTVEGPTPGECYRLPRGRDVSVHERPGGEVVATLPQDDPPHAVEVRRTYRDGWYAIRAGYGPYVSGFVQAELTPCAGPRPEPESPVGQAQDGLPWWMSQERNRPLHRIAAGTRLLFQVDDDRRYIARMQRDGFAREIGRPVEGLVDVFVTVDDQVAMRGLVAEDALSPHGNESSLVGGVPGSL
ncbi:MAG: hypothetical protein ACFCGT_17895 [Sandaracinaceae bacterium]